MPEWRLEIRRRLVGVPLRPEREAEIADELAQHLEDRYQSLLAAGQSAVDAERGAWRELEDEDVLGRRVARVETAASVTLASAESTRRGSFTGALWQDVRYAGRRLRAHPLVSATVVVTLALSLGPTTAVFGLADALFFRPLPSIADQNRLVNYMFGTPYKDGGISPSFLSYVDLADITRGAAAVAAVAGHQGLNAGLTVEGASPRQTSGEAVTANFFEVLGVRLAAGRPFSPDEDRTPGGEPVLILTEGLALSFFSSDAGALGRTVLVNGVPFTVIGVAPGAFRGPTSGRPSDFWITGMAYARATNDPPARWAYGPDRGPFYAFIVRMSPGATVPGLTAELDARTQAPAGQRARGSSFSTTHHMILQPGFAAPASLRPLALRATQLIGAVAALLVLLGMANVANLMIFQSLSAGRDVAIRKALGASTGRLVQLRLTESLLLSACGASAGIGVSLAMGHILSDFQLPGGGAIDIAVDWRVLAATLGLAVIVGVGFGLAPSVLAVRASMVGALGRGLRAGLPHASRLRHALAALQVAVSLTLLVGALLFLATLHNLHAVDVGFNPRGVTIMGVGLYGLGYTDARALDYSRRVAETVRRQPGVEAVAIAEFPPLSGFSNEVYVYRPDQDPAQKQLVLVNTVSADYFRALGLDLVRGRAFTEQEAFADVRPQPVVVSEAMARRLFGSTDAVGRELRRREYQAPPTALRVIGVTRDAHVKDVDSPPDPTMYEPLVGLPLGFGAFVLVRSNLDSARVGRLVRDAGTALDPAVPLKPETTFAEMIGQRLGQQRLFAWILSLLGAIGFTLAAVGLNGLVAQTVVERAREFGIRLAIGADRSHVMRLVLRQATTVGIAGLAGGLTLAWFAGRVIESRLYGVTSRDPWLYTVAALMMMMVVGVASAAPARAATRVNPIDVLRVE
jgi:predicted permease